MLTQDQKHKGNGRYTSYFIECPWCGQDTRLELVQSHYQCTNCKRPVLDCCDGETADAS